MIKKIVLNIFTNRTYLSALLLTIFLLILIMILKNSIFVPLFKKDLIATTLTEATKISKHLSRTVKLNSSSNMNTDMEMKMILEEFKINKIHFYSSQGEILYSTLKESIGKTPSGTYFQEHVANGKIYSSVKDNDPSIVLFEIYIPIMENNTFIGAYEFYYDISNKIIKFENNVKEVSLYMNFFNIAFFLIIFTLLYFASKNNLEDIKYQNELQNFKNIIDETKAYVFTKDINGCYTFANKLVLELFNVSLEELIGKDDSFFFDLEVSNELKKNDALVMEQGQYIEKEELNVVKETGAHNIYWSVKRPLYNKKGKVIGMSGISTDITERKMLVREIKEQKELLNIILDNVDAYVYIKDSKRNFRYVNAHTAELFRKSPEEIIGRKDTEVLPKEMADIFWESDKEVFGKNEKVSTGETIIDPKGEEKHYWSTKLPYELYGENVLIGFSSDITEIYNLKEQLRKDSITDSLTGLYNKRHFDDMAEKEYQRSNRQNLDMTIVIFDIDYFKQINDKYGHHVGDLVLKESSTIFQSHIREEDILCRIGGEEFTIILPHTSKDKAFELVERIRSVIENNIFKTDQNEAISITISFGISSICKTDDKYDEILQRADKALYKAKKTGRNKVVSS